MQGMLPLRDGPPHPTLLDLLKPHPGPVRIEELFYCRPCRDTVAQGAGTSAAA
jgi:hypothetical protein